MKIPNVLKWIVGLPALLFFMAGFMLTVIGLGFITVGKYLVLLVEE
jgi:hypothetical protein